MLNINLATGSFHVIEGHNGRTVLLNDTELPVKQYEFNREAHLRRLPPIAHAYEVMVRAGLSGDEIIALLIEHYLPFRFFKVGHFKRMPLVIGLIGMRGSGKSASMVGIAITDWLLRGKPVWSNVPISVRVVYKDAEKTFESLPLERIEMLDLAAGYRDGLVCVDEVNLEGAEAMRTMSGANLAFSGVMQQIRKRNLSVLWTCQGWEWLDNRLRFQSDFVISCRDAFLAKEYGSHALGERSVWRVHDLSGTTGAFDQDFSLKHKYISDYLVWEGTVLIKTFWDAYSTEQLQGQSDYIAEFRDAKRNENRDKAIVAVQDAQAQTETAIKDMWERKIERFDADEFWNDNNITELKDKQRVGHVLNKFYRRRRNGTGYFYERIAEVEAA